MLFPLALLILLIPIINLDGNYFAFAKKSDNSDGDNDNSSDNTNQNNNNDDKDDDDDDKDDNKKSKHDDIKKDKKSKKDKKKKKSKDSEDNQRENIAGSVNKVDNKMYDRFGIKYIYPTTTNGQEWFLNMVNPLDDSRFSPFNLHTAATDPNLEISQNNDGSWKLKSKNSEAKVRMDVFTSEGYHPERIETLDHAQLAEKGYMESRTDWKNAEITGYIKLNHYTIPPDEGKFTWYNRGGHHSESNPCEGVGYKGSIYFSGDTKFSKEQWHVSYVFSDIKKADGPIKDKWIGYKFITYNIENPEEPSRTMVKMESWLDPRNDGNWIKVDEHTDTGNWGQSGKKCDGDKDQIITWGGPIATFRWDFADDVDFKNLSVREIQPPVSSLDILEKNNLK